MSLFDPVRWAFQQHQKDWCVVRVGEHHMVVPTKEVINPNHIAIKDLTHKEAKMWEKMMR